MIVIVTASADAAVATSNGSWPVRSAVFAKRGSPSDARVTPETVTLYALAVCALVVSETTLPASVAAAIVRPGTV